MAATVHSARRVRHRLSLVTAISLAAGIAAQAFGGAVSPLPPIAIPVHLTKGCFVTAVVNDANGIRVKNLVSDAWSPAGDMFLYWNGSTERTTASSVDSLGSMATPGQYAVSVMTHDSVNLRYEFSMNNAGNPPWGEGGSNGWAADHSPPYATLYLPDSNQMVIASEWNEGGDGLVVTDMTGRKVYGAVNMLGSWTAASQVAKDKGANAVAAHWFYAAANNGGLRLAAIARGMLASQRSFTGSYTSPGVYAGLAAYNGIVVVGFQATDTLRFFNAATLAYVADVKIGTPVTGLSFDGNGKLLVCTDVGVDRYTLSNATTAPALSGKTTVVTGLTEPYGMCVDNSGNIYVSQQAQKHQVIKYDGTTGTQLLAYGVAGVPSVGAYNYSKMNRPVGVSVDGTGRLWVAERDWMPKRVSVWKTTGALDTSYMGPTAYGGGGAMDPLDRTRFYYMGMEFKVTDWNAGTWKLDTVCWRNAAYWGNYVGDPNSTDINNLAPIPETPFPVHCQGHLYLSNSFNGTCSNSELNIWMRKPGGRAEIVARFTNGTLWVDRNNNGVVDAGEKTTGASGWGYKVNPDMSVTAEGNWLGAPYGMFRYPANIDANGIPQYTTASVTTVTSVATGYDADPLGSASGITMSTPDVWWGWDHSYVKGMRNDSLLWSYPSHFAGIQPSQHASYPAGTGYMIGVTRFAGSPFTIGNNELFGMLGNKGQIFVMTTDGFFVSTLFKDSRIGAPWGGAGRTPALARNALLNDYSLGEECFGPEIQKGSDGKVYVSAGAMFNGIVRVDGLETVARQEPILMTLTQTKIDACVDWIASQVVDTVPNASLIMKVTKPAVAPVVDGQLTEAAWTKASWTTLETTPFVTRAAIVFANGKLYGAYKTTRPDFLSNTGGMGDSMLFKTGGAIDLMMRTNTYAANQSKTMVLAGDIRLLITRVGSVKKAMVYDGWVSGAVGYSAYTTACGTTQLAGAYSVSDSLSLAEGTGPTGMHQFEFSLPLSGTHFKTDLSGNPYLKSIAVGASIRAAAGFLAANSGRVLDRIYNCYENGLVSDVSCELRLEPQYWNYWKFVSEDSVVAGNSDPVLNRAMLPASGMSVRMLSNRVDFDNQIDKQIEVRIFTLDGRMAARTIVSPKKTWSFDSRGFSTGVYFYSLSGAGMPVVKGKLQIVR